MEVPLSFPFPPFLQSSYQSSHSILNTHIFSVFHDISSYILQKLIKQRIKLRKNVSNPNNNINDKVSIENAYVHKIGIIESDIQYCYSYSHVIGQKWIQKLMEYNEYEIADIVKGVLHRGKFLEKDIINNNNFTTNNKDVNVKKDIHTTYEHFMNDNYKKKLIPKSTNHQLTLFSHVNPSGYLHDQIINNNSINNIINPIGNIHDYNSSLLGTPPSALPYNNTTTTSNDNNIKQAISIINRNNHLSYWNVINKCVECTKRTITKNDAEDEDYEIIPNIDCILSDDCINVDVREIVGKRKRIHDILNKKQKKVKQQQYNNKDKDNTSIMTPRSPSNISSQTWTHDKITPSPQSQKNISQLITQAATNDTNENYIIGALKTIGRVHLWEQLRNDKYICWKEEYLPSILIQTSQEQKKVFKHRRKVYKQARKERLGRSHMSHKENTTMSKVVWNHDNTTLDFDLGEVWVGVRDGTNLKRKLLCFRSLECVIWFE